MKPIVRIGWVNFFTGFSDEVCLSHVLMDLSDEFTFVFDNDPDVLLVGCYSQQPVSNVRAIKVGYYTENLAPDLINFDYFFGCEYTDAVRSPKYCKRVFGPLAPGAFDACIDPDAALQRKTRFCNFIYRVRIPFRERFCAELTRQYKRVSAPGISMNNCSDLGSRSSGTWQQEKLDYLRAFKFTIAFENSRRIGYTTEKLYDALEADTVPIYWGDPRVDAVVNRDALVVVDADWDEDVLPWLRLPETKLPYQPFRRDQALGNKLRGRANDLTTWLRARVPYTKGFKAAIDEIRELDNDDNAYMAKLAQPRLKPDMLKMRSDYFEFWRGIIRDALSRKGAASGSRQDREHVLAP
jgi:alpha(1,3/1,4) fucosyltransferase